VSALTDRQWFIGAVVLYGLSSLYSIFLWRRGFRHHNRVTYLLLLAGFLLNTGSMLKRGLATGRCPTHNLYEAASFMIWTVMAVYVVVGLWGRLRFLGAFASPLVFAFGAFALMPALDQSHGPQPDFSIHWASLHAALILLSYGGFALSFVAALMYLTQVHNLKFDKLRAALSLLPPVQRLEVTMGVLLLSGFALLTLGLGVASKIERPAGVNLFGDTKVVWSMVVWLMYLGLILLRWVGRCHGRRLAVGLIGAFAFVLLTFWGTNLLSTLHNPPAPPA